MTERKPAGVSFETWVDRQIREAAERGEFDSLRGSGHPIAGLDGHHDESWWVREKLKREETSWLPPTLALRRDAEVAVEEALAAPTENDARRIIDAVNTRIREAIRTPLDGPPMAQMPLDVDRIVDQWRATRSVPPDPEPAPVAERRRPWWRRGHRPQMGSSRPDSPTQSPE